jgi:hypothetical protein
MLLELQRDSQTSVIRHPTIKAVIDQCIGNVDSSSEDLVQVSTQSMGDSVWIHCIGETEEVQLSVHVGDVVVKVTTHHNSRVHILLDDILDDISHSVCSILLELLLTRFKVAVEYLNLVLPCCHSIPARSCYLSELSRSILPLHDRLLSHHSVTTPEEFILHSYGWISSERFPWLKRIL